MPANRVQTRRPALRVSAMLCAVALALGVSTLLESGIASAHAERSKATVKITKVEGVGKVLANTDGRTLYTLTDGNGSAVACTGQCLNAWPPLEVDSGATLKAGKRVTKLAVDSDGQVTHDGLPLYLFSGDTEAHQANGDGIESFGGTWHVVKVAHGGSSGSGKPSSKGSGGYGY